MDSVSIEALRADIGIIGEAFGVKTSTGIKPKYMTLSRAANPRIAAEDEQKDAGQNPGLSSSSGNGGTADGSPKRRASRRRSIAAVCSLGGEALPLPILRKFDRQQSELNYKKKARPRLIICDDNMIHAAASKIVFDKYFESVFFATNGKQVLELLEHTVVDAIFIDAVMPVLSAAETCEIIRHTEEAIAQRAFRTLIVAMVTREQSADQDIMDALFLSGVDRYIVKPLVHHVHIAVAHLTTGQGTAEGFRRLALEKQWHSRGHEIGEALKGAAAGVSELDDVIFAASRAEQAEGEMVRVVDELTEKEALRQLHARQRREDIERMQLNACHMRETIADLRHRVEVLEVENSKIHENRNQDAMLSLEARNRDLQRLLDAAHHRSRTMQSTIQNLETDIKNLLENGSANEKLVIAAERRSDRAHIKLQLTEQRMMLMEDHLAQAAWYNYYGSRELIVFTSPAAATHGGLDARTSPFSGSRGSQSTEGSIASSTTSAAAAAAAAAAALGAPGALPQFTTDVSLSWYKEQLKVLMANVMSQTAACNRAAISAKEYLLRRAHSSNVSLESLKKDIMDTFSNLTSEVTGSTTKIRTGTDEAVASVLMRELQFWRHVHRDELEQLGEQVGKVLEEIRKRREALVAAETQTDGLESVFGADDLAGMMQLDATSGSSAGSQTLIATAAADLLGQQQQQSATTQLPGGASDDQTFLTSTTAVVAAQASATPKRRPMHDMRAAASRAPLLRRLIEGPLFDLLNTDAFVPKDIKLRVLEQTFAAMERTEYETREQLASVTREITDELWAQCRNIDSAAKKPVSKGVVDLQKPLTMSAAVTFDAICEALFNISDNVGIIVKLAAETASGAADGGGRPRSRQSSFASPRLNQPPSRKGSVTPLNGLQGGSGTEDPNTSGGSRQSSRQRRQSALIVLDGVSETGSDAADPQVGSDDFAAKRGGAKRGKVSSKRDDAGRGSRGERTRESRAKSMRGPVEGNSTSNSSDPSVLRKTKTAATFGDHASPEKHVARASRSPPSHRGEAQSGAKRGAVTSRHQSDAKSSSSASSSSVPVASAAGQQPGNLPPVPQRRPAPRVDPATAAVAQRVAKEARKEALEKAARQLSPPSANATTGGKSANAPAALDEVALQLAFAALVESSVSVAGGGGGAPAAAPGNDAAGHRSTSRRSTITSEHSSVSQPPARPTIVIPVDSAVVQAQTLHTMATTYKTTTEAIRNANPANALPPSDDDNIQEWVRTTEAAMRSAARLSPPDIDLDMFEDSAATASTKKAHGKSEIRVPVSSALAEAALASPSPATLAASAGGAGASKAQQSRGGTRRASVISNASNASSVASLAAGVTANAALMNALTHQMEVVKHIEALEAAARMLRADTDRTLQTEDSAAAGMGAGDDSSSDSEQKALLAGYARAADAASSVDDATPSLRSGSGSGTQGMWQADSTSAYPLPPALAVPRRDPVVRAENIAVPSKVNVGHVVAPGETLESIARGYGVSTTALLAANPTLATDSIAFAPIPSTGEQPTVSTATAKALCHPLLAGDSVEERDHALSASTDQPPLASVATLPNLTRVAAGKPPIEVSDSSCQTEPLGAWLAASLGGASNATVDTQTAGSPPSSRGEGVHRMSLATPTGAARRMITVPVDFVEVARLNTADAREAEASRRSIVQLSPPLPSAPASRQGLSVGGASPSPPPNAAGATTPRATAADAVAHAAKRAAMAAANDPAVLEASASSSVQQQLDGVTAFGVAIEQRRVSREVANIAMTGVQPVQLGENDAGEGSTGATVGVDSLLMAPALDDPALLRRQATATAVAEAAKQRKAVIAISHVIRPDEARLLDAQKLANAYQVPLKHLLAHNGPQSKNPIFDASGALADHIITRAKAFLGKDQPVAKVRVHLRLGEIAQRVDDEKEHLHNGLEGLLVARTIAELRGDARATAKLNAEIVAVRHALTQQKINSASIATIVTTTVDNSRYLTPSATRLSPETLGGPFGDATGIAADGVRRSPRMSPQSQSPAAGRSPAPAALEPLSGSLHGFSFAASGPPPVAATSKRPLLKMQSLDEFPTMTSPVDSASPSRRVSVSQGRHPSSGSGFIAAPPAAAAAATSASAAAHPSARRVVESLPSGVFASPAYRKPGDVGPALMIVSATGGAAATQRHPPVGPRGAPATATVDGVARDSPLRRAGLQHAAGSSNLQRPSPPRKATSNASAVAKLLAPQPPPSLQERQRSLLLNATSEPGGGSFSLAAGTSRPFQRMQPQPAPSSTEVTHSVGARAGPSPTSVELETLLRKSERQLQQQVNEYMKSSPPKRSDGPPPATEFFARSLAAPPPVDWKRRLKQQEKMTKAALEEKRQRHHQSVWENYTIHSSGGGAPPASTSPALRSISPATGNGNLRVA